jgi:hypothetical protein
VLLGFLFWSVVGPAMVLPERFEKPLQRLESTFDAELAAAGSDGAARFRAFEKAFEEVEAAFAQLRRRSDTQLPPPVERNCLLGVLGWSRGARVAETGRATPSDVQLLRQAGFPLSVGRAPFQNAEALERYRDFGDLTTGALHLEVAQRLRAFLDHVERAYFGDAASLGDEEEVQVHHAFLRHLSRLTLPAFILSERLSFSARRSEP